jgi:hypothetical protein
VKPENIGKVRYRYGVQRTCRGKVSTYLCRVRDESELQSNNNRYPEKDGGIVLGEKVDTIQAEEAYSKAELMLSEINCPGKYKVLRGDVAHHSDCQGSHQAVVLGEIDDMVMAVFVTSSVGFGVRRASVEELGCLGYRNTRDTYLAPVIRPMKEFTSEGFKFPEYRVQELIDEFFPGSFTKEESI